MQSLSLKRPVAALAAGCALLLAGCAVTRSTFDIPSAKPAEATSPQATVYVKLVEVADKRVFEEKPSNPATPSLEHPQELKDPAITARAIARKRGGFGNAAADILLPPGRTVAQVVTEAITDALHQRGYAVVQPGAPQYDTALPLGVDIRQFWSWLTPGFWTISLENESILLLRGAPLFAGEGESVRGYAIVNTMAATDGEWQRTMQLGVQDLVEKVKAKLPQPQAVKPPG
jgi:hypothetical protein